jgi:hypothetical protein
MMPLTTPITVDMEYPDRMHRRLVREGRTLAEIRFFGFVPGFLADEEMDALADLFAAAPVMLQALTAQLPDCKPNGSADCVAHGSGVVNGQRWGCIVRGAIALAQRAAPA